MAGGTSRAEEAVRGIEGYSVVCRLSRSETAEVFLARARPPAPSLVVVKTLPRASVEDPERLALFEDETRLARMLDHPNVVRLLDAGVVDGRPYAVFEHVDGPTLRDLFVRAYRRGHPMDARLAATLAIEVCAGVQHAHEQKTERGTPLDLVHRDISPQNLMVTLAGQVKILDFGVASAAGQRHRTGTGGLRGKTAYSPPEYIEGGKPDRRGDVFAVGVVLWELLAGRRLFLRPTTAAVIHAVLHEVVRPPSDFSAAVNPALARATMLALERDPEKRWVSARAMRGGLEKALDEQGGRLTPTEVAAALALEFPGLAETSRDLDPGMSDDQLSQVALSASWSGEDDFESEGDLLDTIESVDLAFDEPAEEGGLDLRETVETEAEDLVVESDESRWDPTEVDLAVPPDLDDDEP